MYIGSTSIHEVSSISINTKRAKAGDVSYDQISVSITNSNGHETMIQLFGENEKQIAYSYTGVLLKIIKYKLKPQGAKK